MNFMEESGGRSVGRYSSHADSSHGVQFLVFMEGSSFRYVNKSSRATFQKVSRLL
jgi:hypothetical protein